VFLGSNKDRHENSNEDVSVVVVCHGTWIDECQTGVIKLGYN